MSDPYAAHLQHGGAAGRGGGIQFLMSSLQLLQMEKVALKVALVEEDGAPLFVYFLSWLQYMLLFVKVHSSQV